MKKNTGDTEISNKEKVKELSEWCCYSTALSSFLQNNGEKDKKVVKTTFYTRKMKYTNKQAEKCCIVKSAICCLFLREGHYNEE